jgi:hypothetical protein
VRQRHSPCLRYLATTLQQAGFTLLELETGTTKPVFQAKENLTKLSFSEDGKQLAFVADWTQMKLLYYEICS